VLRPPRRLDDLIPVLSKALFRQRVLCGESCDVFDIPAARTETLPLEFQVLIGYLDLKPLAQEPDIMPILVV
jgi:hypothetical protein